MKQYPSISKDHIHGVPFYVFDKLDGSNLRADFSAKKGFWKFGTRTRLTDLSDPIGKLALPLIQAQEAAFAALFQSLREREATCFFEFWGPSSFAGVHDYQEAGHRVDLIDVSIHRRGFMGPKEFVKTFEGHVPTAPLLYMGNVTEDLTQAVWDGTLPGMTFEGVVCKGAPLKKGYPPHMFKLKSQAWIARVKSLYTDPAVLAELL